MDGWIDLSFHPILDVIASIIYVVFRDQAAIFFEHIAACPSAFLLLSIYITQQTKGFYYGYFTGIARRGGFASVFMAVKLICIKVLLGVYTHMPPVA